MKKYLLVLASLLLAISLVVSGCGRKAKAPTNETKEKNQAQTTQQESKWSTFKASLKDLMDKNKALKCSWQATDEDGNQMKGITYVQGKKFRQDVTITLPEEKNGLKEMEVHSISDGQWMYTWNSVQPEMGMKINLAKAQEQASQYATSSETNQQPNYQQGPDLNKKVEYKCEAWQPNESKFTPPSDINFMDPTAMIENMINAGGQNPLPSSSGSSAGNTQAPAGLPNLDAMKQRACAACKQAPSLELQQKCLREAGCEE
jgi:hypothetical protein